MKNEDILENISRGRDVNLVQIARLLTTFRDNFGSLEFRVNEKSFRIGFSFIKSHIKNPRCARPFPSIEVFMTAFRFLKGLINNFRVARGHFSL